MTSPIDKASSYMYGVALGDNLVGLFTDEVDPSVSGFEAPVGSCYLRGGASGGTLWRKTGSGDTDWTEVSGGGGGGFDPGKTVIVAKSGGDYTSIKAACDYVATQSPSASDAWAVIVYPGIYTEDPITVPAYCNLFCAAPAGAAVIVANTTTSPIVTMGGYSTLNGFLLQGATGSGGVGVYCPSTCTNYIVQNNIISNCESGIKVSGAGTPVSTVGNILGCQMSRAPGQTMVTALDASAGALVACSPLVIFGTPFSMITTGIRSNGAIVQMAGVSVNFCTTGTLAEGQSVFSHSAAHYRACTTAIAIDDAGTNVKCNSTIIEECTTDINLMDSGVTGYFAGSLDVLKTNIADAEGFFIQSFLEKPGEGGFKVVGDMDVGRHDRKARAAFGGGGATIEKQYVFTNTNGTAGTWADITDVATEYGGSFNLFPGTGAGNCIYVGSEHDFPAIIFDAITTALVVGSGSLVAEYWNGSAWTEMQIMQTIAGQSYANAALMNTGTDVVIRLGELSAHTPSTLNGQLAYWCRWRIVTAITTIPVASRMLHFPSGCTVIGDEGYVAFFGEAKPTRPIPLTPLYPLSGFTASSYIINTNVNTKLQMAYVRRDNGKKDGSGSTFTIPEGLDTSQPITFHILWAVVDSGSGDVENELYLTNVSPDDVLDGSLTTQQDSDIVTVGGTAHKVYESEHEFLIPEALPNDTYYWTQVRDATSGNPDDTYGSDTYLVGWALTGTFWR